MTQKVVSLNAYKPMTASETGLVGGPNEPPSAPGDTVATTIHNEQTKLRAGFLNSIGNGFAIASVVVPLTVFLNQKEGQPPPPEMYGAAAILAVTAFILHISGILVLRRLR